MTDVDVLVIGSGAGGLVASVALARAGKRVHVVEQHDRPGGYCHSFTLEGFRFSPGFHYVGDLGPNGFFRRLLEGLDVGGDVTFFEANRAGYEHIHTATGTRFAYPAGRAALEASLIERFPSARNGVHRYLDVLENMNDEWFGLARTERWRDVPVYPFRAPASARYGLFSTQRVLRHFIDDPLCRSVLAAQWGDIGMPPSRSPFAVHGLVTAHYLDGAFYPQGGGAAFVKAFTRGLKRHRGTLEVSRPVERILVEKRGSRKQVIGARFADGTEVRTNCVVSNADPTVMWRLVGDEHTPPRVRHRLARTKWSVSALSLFLAIDVDLRAAGIDSGNYWLGNVDDPEKFILSPSELDSTLPFPVFVNVTTLKDPTCFDGRHHVLELLALVDYEPFARWERSVSGERPADYESWKERLAARMIAQLERLVPGVSRHVAYQALGTPLTNVHFAAATRGALYGIERTAMNLGPWGGACTSTTPIDGLYQCGASTFAMGIMAAMISGLRCAGGVLGCDLEELLTPGGAPVSVYPAEDPSRWPEDFRTRMRMRAARIARPA